jgi:hypothetical protein
MAAPLPRSSKQTSYRFPLEQDPSFKTVITFEEYRRPTASSVPSVGETRTVILPLPLNIPDNTQILTADANLGPFWSKVFEATRKGYAGVKDPEKGFWDKVGIGVETAGKLKDSFIEDFTGGSNDFQTFLALNPKMKDSDLQRYAQSQTGVILNPHTTLMFDGVSLKSYALQFRCSPRSRRENDEIQAIIQMIKERILPTRSPNEFALNYPDTVQIEFENTRGLPKINKSFITGFEVDYTSGTGISFYQDGKPVEYKINMLVKEVEIRTREMIDGSIPEVFEDTTG